MTMPNARTTITAVALSLLSTCALAEWTQVSASGEPKVVTYADTDTLLVLGDKVQLLTLTDYQEAQSISATQKFKSVTMQDEFNCKDGTGRHINLTAMSENMGKGTTVAVEMKPAPLRTIKPQTSDADMLAFACQRK